MAATDIHERSLGQIIEERRLQLGLTKSEAARRADVSRGTWHEVEGDKRTNMLADTLNLFDQALQWERGTLHRLSKHPEMFVSYRRDDATDIVEFKHQLNGDEAALRWEFVRFAVSLSAEQIRDVIRYIETGESSVSQSFEQMRTQIQEQMRADLAEMVEAKLQEEKAARDGSRKRSTSR